MVALAAGLRFFALGHQSYWYDESVTVTIVRGSLGSVFSSLPHGESTPPLYYVLAWVWAKLAGTGEVGLRSFSALVGALTVPVAWAATRRLIGVRAGIVAAALVAVNPMLVWYSQEARAYALLVLLCAISFLFFVRLHDQATPANMAGWATASALALLTHYFAVFVVAVELVWLFVELPGARRRLMIAAGPVLVVGLALAPLALHQERGGRTAWIAAAPLGGRIVDVLHELGSGNVGLISSASSAPHGGLGPITVALVLVGVVLAVVATTRRERIGAAIAATIGVGSLLAPLAAALVSVDFFKDRNLITAWVPLAAALAAGLAAKRTLAIGIATTAAICGLGIAVDIQVMQDRDLQRQNWRALAHALGPARETRAVVVLPAYATTPLEIYGQRLGPAIPGIRLSQIDVVGQVPSGTAATTGPYGTTLVEDRSFQGLRMLRYRTRGLITLTAAALRRSSVPVLLQAGPHLGDWLAAYARQMIRWEQAVRTLRTRSAGRPTAALLTPAVRPSALLSLPPELAGEARLRNALRRALHAAAALAVIRAPQQAAAASFEQALKEVVRAL